MENERSVAWTKWQIETLYQMRDHGHTYAEIGKRIGKSEKACKMYIQRQRSCHYGPANGRFSKKNTLCWGCINAVPDPHNGYGCSWSIRLEPVDGWYAEGTRLLSYANTDPRDITSYRVIKCPKFQKG